MASKAELEEKLSEFYRLLNILPHQGSFEVGEAVDGRNAAITLRAKTGDAGVSLMPYSAIFLTLTGAAPQESVENGTVTIVLNTSYDRMTNALTGLNARLNSRTRI